MIRDIHPGDNLQPRDRGILQVLRDFENLLEEPIYTLTNEQIFFFRFDVDVAGPFLRGATQDDTEGRQRDARISSRNLCPRTSKLRN